MKIDILDPIMSAEIMTIREMCDAFDVTARTLRFYESKELLSPTREGQRRLYSRRDRARLKLILRGKRFGFSLEEIRQLLELYVLDDGQTTQLTRTLDIARGKLTELQTRRSELDVVIDEMQAQMTMVEDMLANAGSAAQAAE